MAIDEKLKSFIKVTALAGATNLAGLMAVSSVFSNTPTNYVRYQGTEYRVLEDDKRLIVATSNIRLHDLNKDGVADYKTIKICHPSIGCFFNVPTKMEKNEKAVYTSVIASFK